MQNIYKILILLITVTLFSACEMNFVPSDQITTESIPNSPDGLANVTNGNYAMFKDVLEFNGFKDDNNCYVRQYFQMSDFSGDDIVCGATFGRIRKMEDERNQELKKISASDVAVIYGLTQVPKAGDILNVVENKNIARQISAERTHIRQEREKYQIKTNLDNLFQKIKESDMNEIKLIVKGDTDGSVEALCDSFQKLSTEEVKVNIIRKAVGGINEADVNMASASDAVIIGFHVRANSAAKKLAEDESIEIKLYQIIYEAIEDMQKALSGMLAPELKEKYLGTALVKQVFKIKKVGSIAGCYVEKGAMTNSGKVRLYRNDIMVHEGELAVLKHYADELK